MSFDPRERSSIEYRAQVFAIRRGVSSLVTDCGCKLSVSGYTIPLSDLKDRLGKVAHHPGALRRIAGTSTTRKRFARDSGKAGIKGIIAILGNIVLGH